MPRLGILVRLGSLSLAVFTSLAEYLLDVSIGPMQKPAAALVRPFTIINKVAGTCDELIAMIAQLTKRGKGIGPRIVKDTQRFTRFSINVSYTTEY